MPWTYADWANADWSAAAILNEFVDAFHEREEAAGFGAFLAAVNIGDDVQAATFFTQFQQRIELRLGNFVVSHDAGAERPAGYYDNTDTIALYANLAAVFDAAGLAPHANWRRYTTHPSEGGVVAYGQMQRGDIIGPWIFEDIQKCLNALKWTYHSGFWATTWIDGGELNAKLASQAGYATEAAAKAGVAALYALAAPYSTSVPPRAISVTDDFPPPLWSAELTRLYAYAQYVRGAAIPCAREIDFHYRGVRPAMLVAEEFDPNGDFPAGYVEGRASYFSTAAPTISATVVSGPFGDVLLPQPNWSPNPGPVGRGYDVAILPNHTEVIERWTGFTYQ